MLAIHGNPDEVDRFIDGLKPADNPDEPGQVSVLESYIPLTQWEYEVALQTWGVKWPDTVGTFDRGDGGYSDISLYLTTPWGPPLEGIRRVSELFPELSFALSWTEPGMCFYGLASISRGFITMLEEGDLPDFYFDADDDPESWDRGSDREFEFESKLSDRCEAVARGDA
jgi:hypothetical protein